MINKVFIFSIFLSNFLFISKDIQALNITEVNSASGVNAYLFEDKKNPIVSVSFQFSGGASSDPIDKQGLSKMVSLLLDEGAGNFSSFDFQSRLENNGIRLNFNSTLDSFSGNLTTITENIDEAIKLLSLAITSPRFDEEPISRIKKQIESSIIVEEERPRYFANKKIYELIYPNHPYGRSRNGTLETLENISKMDLINYVKTRFSKDNLIVGVSGDISPEQLSHLLDKVFGNLPNNTLSDSALSIVSPKYFGTVVENRKFPQSVIIATSPGVSRDDKDWYAALVANHILGGGSFTARLMQEIREKKGLAYSVGSSLVPYKYSNLLYTSLGTKNESVAESIKTLKHEWEKFQKEGISYEELKLAKDYITGSWPLRFTSSTSIASILVSVQYNNLGINYLSDRNKIINSINVQQVNDIIKKIFDVKKLSFLIVGMPVGVSP